jgi:hypothetical protein
MCIRKIEKIKSAAGNKRPHSVILDNLVTCNNTKIIIKQNRTEQNRIEQDRAGQGRAGQDRTGQDRTGQNRTEQNKPGQNRIE